MERPGRNEVCRSARRRDMCMRWRTTALVARLCYSADTAVTWSAKPGNGMEHPGRSSARRTVRLRGTGTRWHMTAAAAWSYCLEESAAAAHAWATLGNGTGLL